MRLICTTNRIKLSTKLGGETQLGFLQPLESALADAFKGLPNLPKGFTDFLAKIAPILTLIFGIIGLLSAYGIYRWVNEVSDSINGLNSIARSYGVETVKHDWSLMITISLVVLVVTSVIYIMAYSPLKQYKKYGWDLLFLAFLVNIVSNVLIAFTDYGKVANLVGVVIGVAIGAYFLFQVRPYYTGKLKVDTGTSSIKNTKKESE